MNADNTSVRDDAPNAAADDSSRVSGANVRGTNNHTGIFPAGDASADIIPLTEGEPSSVGAAERISSGQRPNGSSSGS